MKKIFKKITPLISIGFFCFALWFLDRKLRNYDISEITHQLSAIPNHYIFFSILLSALSYLVLTAYDALGVRYIGEDLSLSKTVRAGYVGYAFSHNIGLALITGGSIRYRIYSAWGFSGLQVTQIVAFSAFTLWIGFCSVAGFCLLFATPNLPADVLGSYLSIRIAGVALLLMLGIYLGLSAKIKDSISIKSWTIRFPSLKIALEQIVIASVDWLLAASVLYVLLPSMEIRFFNFAGVFLVAQIAGIFSQVPGGLGVFESIMLLYLSNFMPGSEVLGILVVYRIIYYILPLLGALVVLGYQEYTVNHHKVKAFGEKAIDWAPKVIPQVMSFSVFVGGAIMLFSGSLPSEASHMYWLQHFVPLPVIEMSHFLASLVGASLLVLATALQRRVKAAYYLTIAMLVFGIIFTLLKGASYEEAIILAVMLAALIPCRTEFNRKASLLPEHLPAQWLTMILMVLGSAVWLGVFAYRHVEYQNKMWWEFSLLGDAPRYLRAMVAVLGFAVIIGLIRLLKPRTKNVEKLDDDYLIQAKPLLKYSISAKNNLVYVGQRSVMFSDSHQAMLIYVKENGYRITLGDPVGKEDEANELIRKFYNDTHEEGEQPIFYDVEEQYLDSYLDLGLTRFKIGEDARVLLPEFKADKLKGTEVLSNYNRYKKNGFTWRMLDKVEVKGCLPELKKISEAFLNTIDNREQNLLRGSFDEKYMTAFPVSIVEKGQKIVAFANLLITQNHHEASIDLMRNDPEVSDGIIDFIYVHAMQWAKTHQYEWFNLGLTPLSETDKNYNTLHWHKRAHVMYRYGETMYKNKEVRNRKMQFNPIWNAKYLVSLGGLALTDIISDMHNTDTEDEEKL